MVLPALMLVVGGAAEVRAQAPTGTVTGRVVDASGSRGIEGARVIVSGTTRGALTRTDGQFTITSVPAGAHRIRAAMIGYHPQEQAVTVPAGQSVAVSFQLTAAPVSLNEVVVVGYGTQRREDLTGSIASVSSEELQKTAQVSLEQGLQGRVPGVQVTQGDAAPGGGMRVQIRGVNSMNSGSAEPLYVIDGVPVANSGLSKRQLGPTSEENLTSLNTTNPLAQLSPSDIESIDILKDASATAIYGSRGANGVVLITTKRGRRDTPGQVTLNASQGYASVGRRIDVLTAVEYANYVNKAYMNAGDTANMPFGGSARPSSISVDSLERLVGTGTNWQDEIFRTAPVRDAQLAFSGGDDNGNYFIGGSLLEQGGVIRGSQFRRGGLRVNLDRSLRAPLRVSSNVAVTRSVNDMVRSSTINGYTAPGIVRQALRYTPYQLSSNLRDEDPNTMVPLGSNPIRYTDEVDERDQLTRAVGGVRGVYTFGGGLSLDLNVGSNYERRGYNIYFPSTVAEGQSNRGVASQSGSEFGNIVSENLLRFNRAFGGTMHTVDAIGGFSYENSRATWLSQEVQTFPDDILGSNVLQNGTNPRRPQSGISSWQLASWIGRVNYSLLDRYLLTATVRADGSSKFAENNKWATFPAVAFAWRAINEPFMQSQGLLSDLKLRLSYGKSGNQAIGPYQSLPAVSGVDMSMGDRTVPAYTITQLGNPDLRWETTDQYDAGVDFGFLRDRFTGSVDVYRKNTYDLLQQINLAGNTGFSSAWINSGNVTNRGVELQLGYNVLAGNRLGGLIWNITANASRNRNVIESLGSGKTQQFASRLGAGAGLEVAPFIQKVGHSIGTMWGYQTDGLVRTAADSAAYAAMLGSAARVGDVRYRDVNGDGRINAQDQTKIGDANPDYLWGLSNTFSVGRFDASFLVNAVQGNDIIRVDRMSFLVLNGSHNVQKEYVENAFHPVENPDGRYPMIRQNRQMDNRFSDLYVEDGSFVRLKNVQVGYRLTLPSGQSARLYVNGINLLTSTKYQGFDPEVSAFGGVDRPGVDQGSYPMSRTFTFGVSTNF